MLKLIQSEEQETAGIDHSGTNQYIKERIFVTFQQLNHMIQILCVTV